MRLTLSGENRIFSAIFCSPGMARFSQRNRRLSRQRESAAFRDVLMPLGILIGFVGLLAMLLVFVDYEFNNRWESEAFAAATTAAAIPILLFLCRWIRGHFNRQLECP